MGGIAQIWKSRNAEFQVIISVSVATSRKKIDRYWRIIMNETNCQQCQFLQIFVRHYNNSLRYRDNIKMDLFPMQSVSDILRRWKNDWWVMNGQGYWRMRSCPSRGRLCLKCDSTRAETRFRLSAKRTSLFKSAGASVQSTTGSRGVHISGRNAGYTMVLGSVKGTGYPLHSPVSPSLPLPA